MGKIVFGVLLFLLLLFVGMSMVSYNLPYSENMVILNFFRVIGNDVSRLLFQLFGVGAWFLLFACFLGFCFYWPKNGVTQPSIKTVGVLLMLFSVSTSASFLIEGNYPGPAVGPGGWLGIIGKNQMTLFFAPLGSYIFLASIFIAGTILAIDSKLLHFLLVVAGIDPIARMFTAPLHRESRLPANVNSEEVTAPTITIAESVEIPSEPPPPATIPILEETPTLPTESQTHSWQSQAIIDTHSEIVSTSTFVMGNPLVSHESELNSTSNSPLFREIHQENHEEEVEEIPVYQFPSFDLLPEGEKINFALMADTIRERGILLEKTFADFGLEVRVTETQTGPVLTMYEIALSKGLSIKRIKAMSDDLEIALKVPSVRIVAPIPGKNTVGVEIPNEDRQFVRLRDLIEESAPQIAKMQIPLFLGRDVSGDPMIADLAKLPHLLIAGRTGTGKSVCLNAIIMSILMTRSPDEIRLILIDPKMVELSPYKTVPHLMHSVVTDMKKAEALLSWAVDKMEERYNLFSRAGVRQLNEYNRLSEHQLYQRIKPESDEDWDIIPRSLPVIVIIADEMADLIMTVGKEVETHIARLAQKSRAVGIHLVLATQKPTVDVITGQIKSNLPARIAFGVASRTDSLVVLDCKGAEQLLGNGDLLFLKPGTSQVIRGQGTYISDQEIIDVISEIGTGLPDFLVDVDDLLVSQEGTPEIDDRQRDKLYDTCVETVFAEGKASTSLLQRKLRIGYGRAARIIDYMVFDGIAAAQDRLKPSAPRELLMTYDQWVERREEIHKEKNVAPTKENVSLADVVPSPLVQALLKVEKQAGLSRNDLPFQPIRTTIEQEDSQDHRHDEDELAEDAFGENEIDEQLVEDNDFDNSTDATAGASVTVTSSQGAPWSQEHWNDYLDSWESQTQPPSSESSAAEPTLSETVSLRDYAKERRKKKKKKKKK